jgi:hypothetical protein
MSSMSLPLAPRTRAPRSMFFLMTGVLVLSSAAHSAFAQTQPPSLNPTQEIFGTQREIDRSLSGTLLGWSLALRGDTLLAGMPGHPDLDTGRVAVFTKNAARAWQRVGTIDPVSWHPTTFFGERVALGRSRALVGSRDGVDVYLGAGPKWIHEQRLVPYPGTAIDGPVAFGQGWAIVGVTNPDQVGSVQVYARCDRGLWRRVQTLTSGEGEVGDLFGRSLALEGGTLVVGAAGDDSAKGAAYIFKLRNGVWRRKQKLIALDGTVDDLFGRAVAIGNGMIAVSALPDDDSIQCGALGSYGAVYVFAPQSGLWSPVQKASNRDIADPNIDACFAEYGNQIAITDDHLVITSFVHPTFTLGPPILYRRVGQLYQPVNALSVGQDVEPHAVAMNSGSLVIGWPLNRFETAAFADAYDLPAAP